LADDSVTDYAQRLAALLTRPGLVARVGAGARASLCRTWAQVALEVKKRYLELAGSRAWSRGAMRANSLAMSRK
jgi:hypothetical protein